MLRIPQCLDSRFTDGGKVVSPTHRPHSTPQKHYLSASGTHFCERLSKSQGLVRPEGLGKLKKFTSLGLEPVTFRLVTITLPRASHKHPQLSNYLPLKPERRPSLWGKAG
jgi:hypothetical protein